MEVQHQNPSIGKVKYVESYDFKHPKLFSKEIMRSLRTIHDVLSRNLSRVFSSTLRYKVDIYLDKIEQLSSPEFIQGIDSPSVIYSLEVEALGGEIIVVMPPEFCIHLIERQSGGQAETLSDSRTLTVIEEKIIGRLMANINKEIVTAWEPFMDLDITDTTYESKPENLHITSVDPTIKARFQIDIAGVKKEIGVSYSYSLLKKVMNDSILQKSNKSRLEKLSPDEMEGYKRTLTNAQVCIQSLLGTTRLTLNEIINLQEGDTIPLNQKSDEAMDIRINGVTKMKAFPGVKKGRRAVKIYELIEEVNEMELV